MHNKHALRVQLTRTEKKRNTPKDPQIRAKLKEWFFGDDNAPTLPHCLYCYETQNMAVVAVFSDGKIFFLRFFYVQGLVEMSQDGAYRIDVFDVDGEEE